MQVNNTSYVTAAIQVHKGGNYLPPTNEQNATAQETSPIRELANSIDPSNMSRNDARAIAAALGQIGELELNNAIALQSMVLVNDNGHLQTATETDSIMNEKFNMFDALEHQIQFNQSKGIPTDALEKGLEFLDKFNNLKENADVNLYV